MIFIVVAHDEKFGIGRNNKLAWKIKEDMQLFKEITKNNTILMGRKTFESLPNGKPLPNRKTLILTRDKTYKVDDKNVRVVRNIDTIIKRYANNPEKHLYVCGGAEIYKQFYESASLIFVSIINGEYACDTFLEDYATYGFTKVFDKIAFNQFTYYILCKDTFNT